MSQSEVEPVSIRILVVDDEPEVIAAYRSALATTAPDGGSDLDALRLRLFAQTAEPRDERTRFQIDDACDAETAVERVRDALRSGRPYGAVFLDMRMPPGPDGMWAAERIRALDPQLDIVVCTAYSDVDPAEFGSRVPPNERLFYVQKPFHIHEVRQMACALGRKRIAEDQVNRLAFFDSLTGLPNRERIRRVTRRVIEHANRSAARFALLYLDLDNFKRINDALGHATGDELLLEIAKRLRSAVRATDVVVGPVGESGAAAEPNDVARLGGDEFLVLLPGVDTEDGAAAVASRIQSELRQPVALTLCEVMITPSIGIALYPQHGEDTDTLFRNADLAMYYAKRRGRGSSVFFSESMSADSLRRLTLETLLRKSLAGRELSLRYQPQIDLRGGEFCGMEALLRWHCPEIGAVSPTEFIPVAEESGLILAIGEWTLREACRQAEAWRQQGFAVNRIAVNVSPLQFSHIGFPDLVARILQETGLPAAYLELEITEGMLMGNEDSARETLRRLKSLGVNLAIDDFGTGYSSLSRLRQLRVDRLKIDRSFVSGINECADDDAIAAAIINMGKTLGLDVVAEGVEDFDQVRFLQQRSCEHAQGFLLSEPLTSSEAEHFLARLSDATIIRRVIDKSQLDQAV